MVAAVRQAGPLLWPKHLREDGLDLHGLALAAQAQVAAATPGGEVHA